MAVKNNNIKYFILIIFVIFFLIFYLEINYSIDYSIQNQNFEKENDSKNLIDNSVKALPTEQFFQADEFYQAILPNKEKNNNFSKKIYGAIIPHHLLASFMIADLFSVLQEQGPDLIILVGPNHFEKGDSKVISAEEDWETPFGILESAKDIVQNLKKAKLIETSGSILTDEHSISGIVPFIKYYLPQTKILPLIFSIETNEQDIEKLNYILEKFFNPNEAVVIASVDFSHYLMKEQAGEKDKITIKALEDFNYMPIFYMNNDYLDSPASIICLLKIMENFKAKNLKILNHTNSGEILQEKYQPTTSYFEIIFYKN